MNLPNRKSLRVVCLLRQPTVPPEYRLCDRIGRTCTTLKMLANFCRLRRSVDEIRAGHYLRHEGRQAALPKGIS
jgi:hypothetical protein